ncbi:acyltransferase [Phocaeicola sp.]
MTSFYSDDEIRAMGFAHIGENVLLSRKASIYSPNNISIGDNVRIDDFVILSGRIVIGSHIHISAYVAIYGANGVVLEDYTGCSPRVTIYSAMDDFGGEYLIGPIHPDNLTNVKGGEVRLKRFSQIGCNSVLFPNIVIEEGTVVGAMSLVRESLPEWSVCYGIPAQRWRARSRSILMKLNYI